MVLPFRGNYRHCHGLLRHHGLCVLSLHPQWGSECKYLESKTLRYNPVHLPATNMTWSPFWAESSSCHWAVTGWGRLGEAQDVRDTKLENLSREAGPYLSGSSEVLACSGIPGDLIVKHNLEDPIQKFKMTPTEHETPRLGPFWAHGSVWLHWSRSMELALTPGFLT